MVTPGRVARVYILVAVAGAALVLTAGPRAQTPAGGAARPSILGIAHMAIRVSNLANARQFYGDLLGYDELQPAQSASVAVFVVNDRQRLVIHDGLPAEGARGLQGPPRAQVSGVQGAPRVNDERLLHIAFETGDVVAMRSYLSARGVTASEATADLDGGGRASDVTDPDGHRVRFIQRDARPLPSHGGARGLHPSTSARGALSNVEGQGPPRAPVSEVQGAPRGNNNDRRISRRILHGGFTIRDAAAADRLYKDILGFSEMWRGGRTDDVTNWINMRVPDGTDYLEYMLVSGSVDRRQLGSLHHVALLVPDIQEALETARTRSDERNARATPQVGRNRRWQLNLFDPDGTRVEFMEPWTIR
jgi:catechol 2,3-dioxygenase-like lactoylglutathione lyase family enzyme